MTMGEQVPKYRYQCDYCHEQWEEWRNLSDPDPEQCPRCELGYPFKIPVRFTKINSPIQEKKTAKKNVVEHIEENREILKKMRNKSKEEEYYG